MYRRTGGQPKPNIILCPNCQKPKDPNISTCLNCNARSCPNGHLLATNAIICSKCGWTDHQWKATPKTSTIAQPPPSPEIPIEAKQPTGISNRCHLCGARLDPRSSYCPSCGNLITAKSDKEPETHAFTQIPGISTPAGRPPKVETYTVHQETIGHKDTKRTYKCPRCQNRVDDPALGHCPHCGYVGTMQYDLTQWQPAWVNNRQTTQVVPPPPPQQSFVQRKPPPRFEEENICPNCGASNPPDSRFCRSCGQRYGIGRVSHQVRTLSTSEWSAAATTGTPAILRPIYAGAGKEDTGAIEMPLPGRKAPPRERKGKPAKVRTVEERKFPIGLLMAITVVAALIIGMGIFVMSKQFSPVKPTTTVDTTPPVISNVTIEMVDDSTAIVKWVTNEPATSQIMLCDPEGVCTWTDADLNLVKNHAVTLENLKQNINYHLTIKSADQRGNEITFERDQMFTGGAAKDTTPPVISDVIFSDKTDIGVIIKWKTDEPATSQVEYGTTKNYGSSTTVDTKLKTNHSVPIIGLNPATLYYFKVISKDAAGNVKSYDSPEPFTTLQAMQIGLQLGSRAPDFTLPDLNDNGINLYSFLGKKIVMINFWYVACGPCKEEMPFIQNIYKNWAGEKPLQILSVNIMDNKQTAKSFMTSNNYTFPVLIDTGTVKSLYSVTEAPTTYFLDMQGIIRHVKKGSFAGQSEIETILKSL